MLNESSTGWRLWHRNIRLNGREKVEAYNNSAFDRLVLIFDIWRPELTKGERDQITAMFEIVDSYR